ncbi:MAG TPA: FAD-dependent oxidoreductase [bacterium]|nr:FAD-dependent oxidoreductase [bacterium]
MWTTVSKGGAQAEDALMQFLPPCQVQCPINEDIQRTNVLISLLPDDPDAAGDGILQIGEYLYEKNPLFTVCGYVCGLCELECNYKVKGGSIRRRLLKRFLTDSYNDYLKDKPEMDIEKTKGTVAVVGGGPGGLMCAWDLSKRGYKVTIFEATDRLGGALWLIPRFRLPTDVLTTACESIVRIAGIDVKYNTRVGEGNLTLDKLRKEGYKAVFIAKGTPMPRILTFGRDKVDNQDLSGVMYGLNFLYEVSHGNIRPDYFKDKRVLVIGGGNVAFDVARTVKRLGGDTSIVCLECEDKAHQDGIPADEEEIKGAWEENIDIVYSRGVSRIIGEGGKFKGIECPRCTCVFDDKGFNPKFDEKDTTILNGDIIIITVGQGPDRGFFEDGGLLDENGRLPVDPVTLQSKMRDWVFIGGDVRKIGFMVEAMQDGLVVAESIERYLMNFDMRSGRKREYQKQDIPKRRQYKDEPEVLWIPPEKRMHFQLFERGFSLKEAIEEAKRCVTCGPCQSCKACVSIGIQDDLPVVEVNEDHCSGCGICTSVCYYDAAILKMVEGKKISDTDTFSCKACGMCVVACPSGARRMSGDRMPEYIDRAMAAL